MKQIFFYVLLDHYKGEKITYMKKEHYEEEKKKKLYMRKRQY